MSSGADNAAGGPPWESGRPGGPPWEHAAPGRVRPGGPPWQHGAPWGVGPGGHGRAHHTWHGAVMSAILVGAIEVIGVRIAAAHQPGTAHLDWLGYTLLVVGALALATRHEARVPSLVVTLAATVAYVVLGFPYGPVFLAPLVAIFGAVRAGRRCALWITLALSYTVFLVGGRIWPHIGGYALRQPALGFAIEILVWGALILVIAEVIRARAAHFAEIRRTMIEQARARQEQERRQASEERLRIAQELHDVLGHHLSLISVQAGIGLHLMDEHPEQTRNALVAIKQASAEALGEVRSVLAALRPKDEKAPRAPAPSLGDLSALIDADRVAVTGEPRPLPSDVERAAYRIVQESLTNVRRHAGESAVATVTLSYAPDRLTVRIADNGAGARSADDAGASASSGVDDSGGGRRGNEDSPTGGSGIPGMRTRAESLGGSVTVASPARGGFVVTAVLPVPPSADRPGGTDEPAGTDQPDSTHGSARSDLPDGTDRPATTGAPNTADGPPAAKEDG